MFTHTCSVCAKRQLVFPSMISGILNSEAGIVVAFTCWCGAEQAGLTGAAALGRPTDALVAA